MIKTFSLANETMTRALGRWLGQHLPAGTLLLLQGNLGSGKTTLVKGIGQGLGITDEIDSPTFTLVNEYVDGRLPLYHVDLYRLTAADVGSLFLEHYWDEMEYPLGIVAIEWPERLRQSLPQPLTITLQNLSPAGRAVTLHPTLAVHTTLLETLTPDALLVDEV